MRPFPRHAGFTLAELLIALAILGIIATFTIPKVLNAQADNKAKSIVKEDVAAFVGAFDAYKLKNTVTAATKSQDIMAYVNYVKIDTTAATIDNTTTGAMTCNVSFGGGTGLCYRMHNGSVIQVNDNTYFNGTSSTHAIWFYVDPDGVYGNGSLASQSIVFFLYTNGRLATWGTVLNPTGSSQGNYTPDPSQDPAWFNWN